MRATGIVLTFVALASCRSVQDDQTWFQGEWISDTAGTFAANPDWNDAAPEERAALERLYGRLRWRVAGNTLTLVDGPYPEPVSHGFAIEPRGADTFLLRSERIGVITIVRTASGFCMTGDMSAGMTARVECFKQYAGVEPMSDYQAIVSHSGRSAADRERDPASKPAETLALMGVQPGQTILDFQTGQGYFAELLSYAVGPQGRVLAHNHEEDDRVLSPEQFAERYGNARLPNVELIFAPHNELDLPTRSLDAVLMSMNYHDTYWYDAKVDWGPVDHQAFLAELYDALKPGGVFLVIDHHAEAGANPYESAMQTHRIDKAVVLRDFAAAGFVLQAESDALRNPADAYDTQIFQESVYRATDRFMLLFKRP